MAEKKGKKLRRCGKHANYYKVQPSRTEKNKTKKVVRHFKSNPTCEQTKVYLENKKYNTDDIQLTSKGNKIKRRSA